MANIAWFDGAAIYMAVLIVSGFSAFVDWRKEKEFVKRQQEDEDNNNVSLSKIKRLGQSGTLLFSGEINLICNTSFSNLGHCHPYGR